MHLPDGVLPPREWAPLTAVAGAVVGAAARGLDTTAHVRAIARAGVLAAVVLVLQMVNFPILAGVSGHLIGTVLLAFVLGPSLAALAMACVLLVQAFVLHDGGVLVLGANYVNMVAVPLLVVLPLRPSLDRAWGLDAAPRAALGAFLGSLAGAVACASQLAAAGHAPFTFALTWMLRGHVVIGAVEATLTALVVREIVRRAGRVPPVASPAAFARNTLPLAGHAFAPVLVLAAVAAALVPIASQQPDVLVSLLVRLGHGP